MSFGFGFGKNNVAAISSSGGGYDADAQTFFTTYSITDETTKNAINQLVLNLKGTGGETTNGTNVWAKRISIKPCIGTTATHNGADLSGNGFDTIYVNSPIYANTGFTVDGLSQYARLIVVPSTDTTLHDITICINSSSDDTFKQLIGAEGSGGASQRLSIFDGGGTWKFQAYSIAGFETSDTTGFLLGTRRADDDMEMYRDGVSVYSNAGIDAGTRPDVELMAGCLNENGTPTKFYGPVEISNIGIFSGLTSNEAKDVYDSFAAFDIDMGR